MNPARSRGLGPLRPGARVALLATAGPSPDGQVDRAEALVTAWGLKPVMYPSARGTHPTASYLAAADAVRSNDFTDAWCDESIDGIFCLRGGYGSVRMLDGLDVEKMRAAQPKPVYGSSDVTALHEWLRERLAAPGWFTPMIATDSLLDDAAATEQLRAAVFADPAGRRWSSSAAEVLVPGVATGILIGGNLSLLAQTVGDRGRQPLENAGTIALLEDIGEDTYRIDGFLQTLLRAGWFDGVQAVALGSWQDCNTPEQIRALFLEVLAPLKFPMVWELGFGHGPAAHSIPLGVPGTLRAAAGSTPELVLSNLPE